MSVLAVLIAASTLLFVRHVFGVIHGLLAAAALWFSAYRLSASVNLYMVRFIAVASCLYALLDILTGVPALVWAML